MWNTYDNTKPRSIDLDSEPANDFYEITLLETIFLRRSLGYQACQLQIVVSKDMQILVHVLDDRSPNISLYDQFVNELSELINCSSKYLMIGKEASKICFPYAIYI